MARLRGEGLGTGIALGTAAIVKLRNGFPVPPSIPPRILDQLSHHKLEETPDVILVAEDYQTAVAIADTLRWGNVVGIAAASAAADVFVGERPAVVNVAGLLATVEEDMLMVVDADQGVVVADPDVMAAAKYQSERNQLAPKRRLYLDEGHLPAQTVDGHTIQVFAEVSTSQDVMTALEQGADALFVPFDCPLLPANAEDVEQRENALALIGMAGGKPLLLQDEYTLLAAVLLEAAVKAEVTVVCPLMPHLEGMGVGELGAELNEVRADCLASDISCEMPRFAVLLTSSASVPNHDLEQTAFYIDRLVYNGATRLVVDLDVTMSVEERLVFVDAIVGPANAALMPVFVKIEPLHFEQQTFTQEATGGPQVTATTVMQRWIGVSAAGVIVAPADCRAVKSIVQEQNYAECREALSQFLSAKQPA